jgi:hypothetical protein
VDLGERKIPSCAADLRESLRYVEPLSAASTPLADFVNSLLAFSCTNWTKPSKRL